MATYIDLDYSDYTKLIEVIRSEQDELRSMLNIGEAPEKDLKAAKRNLHDLKHLLEALEGHDTQFNTEENYMAVRLSDLNRKRLLYFLISLLK